MTHAISQMLGVELARPGPWKTTTGQTEFTNQMLRDAADFFTTSGGQAVPIRLGHTDSRFNDGEPTFGSVTNIRYLEDDRGPVLLGDIVGMPGWLAASAPTRWPNRSVQGWQNVDYGGREYRLILSGLSFLGDTPPAVRNIKSLGDLQNALAASSAIPVFASAPDNDPAAPPEAPELDEPEGLSEEDPPDPAPEAVAPPERQKETGMDPAKFREALGLTEDDFSDDDLSAALTAAGYQEAAPPASTPEAVPVAASARLAAKPGTMMVEASAWDAAQERIKNLEAQDARRRVAERDQIIASAVQEGKFAPARKEHWVRLWDADPEGTRMVLGTLAKNVMPVAASGYAGDGTEGELDEEFAHLFPPTATKGG